MSRESWDDDSEGEYEAEQGGEFAALDFTPSESDHDRDGPHADGAFAADGEDEADDPAVTVTNPAGTVSVTAYLTGSVKSVELSPTVVRMTESELGEEIRVIAELSRLHARSAVHAVLLEGLTRLGHDRAQWSSILNRAVQLPSPEEAAKAMAKQSSDRYDDDR